MTTIRMTNGNCVAALQPAPGDLFAVTLLAGKVVFIQRADDYNKALRLAEAFAEGVSSEPSFTVKVLGMSLTELAMFQGTTQEEIAANLPVSSRAEDWKLIVAACQSTLRDCDDAAARREAYDLLVQMGALTNADR